MSPATPSSRKSFLISPWPVFVVIVLLSTVVGCDSGSESSVETPPPDALPSAVQAEPGAIPDFAAISDVQTKKSRFFEYLHKRITKTNDLIWAERKYVIDYRERYRKSEVTAAHTREFAKLVDRYKLTLPAELDESFFESLLARVDVVPASLVLAQGANESAWGTSRFARKGNNFFGIWCYSKGCGLKPSAAAAGTKHEVRKFKTVQAGVSFYAHNINIGHAYDDLRAKRATLRAEERALTGLHLAEGLTRYSERGQEYVDEIKSMIEYNNLARYNKQRVMGSE